MSAPLKLITIALAAFSLPESSAAACPYDPNCLSNPYGAGNPNKSDGLTLSLHTFSR